nr:MAG TPA: hypothetical protein [Caudoviricetes sp.]
MVYRSENDQVSRTMSQCRLWLEIRDRKGTIHISCPVLQSYFPGSVSQIFAKRVIAKSSFSKKRTRRHIYFLRGTLKKSREDISIRSRNIKTRGENCEFLRHVLPSKVRRNCLEHESI